MTIERTATALCDGDGCDSAVEIDPTSAQPYHLLLDAGWGVDLNSEAIFTYCPEHKRSMP